MSLLKAASIQVNASADMAKNIQTALTMIERAASNGASFICLPENVSMMEFGGKNIIAKAFIQEEHPALIAFCDKAKELDIWLQVGSLAITQDENKVANRSFMISNDGKVTATYDKIHLFDVDLPGGESYRESNTFVAGQSAVISKTPWGLVGLTICYDVRFPQLYRELAKSGASILTVPAAFTKQTGIAHWETLLRARAIETGCFIIATGQCGSHKGGRETYGHSLIIDPWGQVIAKAGDEPEILLAELDLSMVETTRQKIPSLKHGRDFEVIKS